MNEKIPPEILFMIIDVIINRKDCDTLFNLYRINKNTNYYINKQKENYKIDKGFYIYLYSHVKNLKICSNCGIYMLRQRCNIYEDNIYGVINLCSTGVYDLKKISKGVKCDPVITTKRNHNMGGWISEIHPDVKKQVVKYNCNNLHILYLLKKYKIHLFFNYKSLFNKVNTFLSKINYD